MSQSSNHDVLLQDLRYWLKGRRIFLTGGTGFVGRSLLDFISAIGNIQDFGITILSRDPAAFFASHPEYKDYTWLSAVQGSLGDLPDVTGEFTDVIHAAADTHTHKSSADWIDQIVNGTRAVLDYSLRLNAERFLFVSSGAVYGQQPDAVETLDEGFSGAPPTDAMSSIYGQAKRLAEQLCTVYFHEHGLATVTARLFAFAGPQIPFDGPYAFGNFVRDALYNETIRVKGSGTAIRTYLDAEDVSFWLLSLLSRGESGQAYNVGGDQAVSMHELAQTVAKALSPDKIVTVENLGSPNEHRSRYVPRIAKAAALGLIPRFQLADIVRRAASKR